MSKPVRMCIHCKRRCYQSELLRLQHKDNQILKYTGLGRSFYICRECLGDNKIAKSVIKKFRLNKNEYENVVNSLKEIGLYG